MTFLMILVVSSPHDEVHGGLSGGGGGGFMPRMGHHMSGKQCQIMVL